MSLDHAALEAFMGKAVTDMGAAISAPMFILGERLGLYKALAAAPATADELAAKTRTAPRYIREWLMNQAAGGYVNYDPASRKFSMSQAQALAMADESSPVYIHGGYEVLLSMFKDLSKFEKCMRTGEGLDWGGHDACLFSGTARFFKPGYSANIVQNWIPSLQGAVEKLNQGAKCADVGCGYGHSTMIMAAGFPKSTFIGFDNHAPSVEAANAMAKAEGLKNVSFQTAPAGAFSGTGYDFIACFDCLHDMGDPIGAAKHIHAALKPEGHWMIVEPFANDKPEDNLNPVGRIFYAASTMVCVPASLASHGPALGAQAGEAKLKEVCTAGGFTRFRRAAHTPFNLVLEARR